MFMEDRDEAVKRRGKYETTIPLRMLLPYTVAADYIWSVEEVKSEGVQTAA